MYCIVLDDWHKLTFLDVLLQAIKRGFEELLLIRRDLAKVKDLLSTGGTKFDRGSKEINTLVLEERAVNEGGLNNALLTLGGLEEGASETSTSESHGEGSGTSAILGLDDFVTTELNTVDQSVTGLAVNARVARLRQERDNGHTRVATNDGNTLVSWVSALELRDEARSADNIEGGDTEDALGVIDTLRLEDLGNNGDSRVDLRWISITTGETWDYW